MPDDRPTQLDPQATSGVCTAEPAPPLLQTAVAVANDLRRAVGRVEQVNALAAWIEHDHRQDPTERAAVTIVTAKGRVAELWRDMRAELAKAEGELDDVLNELDDISDVLSRAGVP